MTTTDASTETQGAEIRIPSERGTITNPFEPGPNYDPARAAALLLSDSELAAHFRDIANGGHDR